jgi:MFS family permease
MKQRKWCGICGTVIMAIGVGILALAPNWPLMLVAAAVFGMGFGMHAGVNVTLAVTVLPTTKESGKFLGVLQDAIFLALIVSPQIGGGILTALPQQFALVFGAAAVVSLLAGAALLPVKAGYDELASLPPHRCELSHQSVHLLCRSHLCVRATRHAVVGEEQWLSSPCVHQQKAWWLSVLTDLLSRFG